MLNCFALFSKVYNHLNLFYFTLIKNYYHSREIVGLRTYFQKYCLRKFVPKNNPGENKQERKVCISTRPDSPALYTRCIETDILSFQYEDLGHQYAGNQFRPDGEHCEHIEYFSHQKKIIYFL